MKHSQYVKRDPIKNYFPLPNDIFMLGLCAGEISVYSYLLYLENRKTFQCWPSYKTIGKAVGMSQNTVRKYVMALEEKGLIRTEPTSVRTRSGQKRNGSLLYTIRPIQEALDLFYEQQLARADLTASINGLWSDWQCPPLSAPVSPCVGFWRAKQAPAPPRTKQANLSRCWTRCERQQLDSHRSPAKRVRWEKEEQRSERFFAL